MTNQLLFRLEETKMEKLMLSEARPGTTYSVLEIKDEVRLINPFIFNGNPVWKSSGNLSE